MRHNMMKRTLYFLMFLLLAGSVFAIGVSPARKYIAFEPGAEETVQIRLLKEAGREVRVVVYAQGAFADSVEFADNVFLMGAAETEKWVSYRVKLGEAPRPGIHDTQIIIIEIPPGDDVVVVTEKGVIMPNRPESATVGAVTSVIHMLQIQVPYPGKYVEGRLFISENMVGEPVNFRIPVYNFGTEDVDDIYARVEILGPTNGVIAELTTERISLPPQNELELHANWQGAVNAGRYHARVTVIYGDKRFVLESIFNVGDIFVRINDVRVEQFTLGEIAKFDIFVENAWNRPLENVYGILSVLDRAGNIISDFKTVSSDLEPYREQVISAYWDTMGTAEGVYDLKIKLFYAGETTERVIRALVGLEDIEMDLAGTGFAVQPEIFTLGRDSLLVTLVVLLVGLNLVIIYLFVLRKKKPPVSPPGQVSPPAMQGAAETGSGVWNG